jgi:O-antigen/teichoic acid export membrane protein
LALFWESFGQKGAICTNLMSKVRKNIFFTAFARGSSSVVNFVMLPLYLPLLGKEAFGLVALGVSLVQLVNFINDGLQPVWVREIARRSAQSESIAPLIRSQEYLRGLLLILILFFHQQIADHALASINLISLDREIAVAALGVLLVSIGFNNFSVTYSLIFWGKQEGRKCAAIIAAKPIWDSFGGYFVLLITKGNPLAFFAWQGLGSILVTVIAGYYAWKPVGREFLCLRLSKSQFRGLGNFGAQSMLLSALMAGIVFSDRWFIGGVISVAAVATYSLLMQPIILVSNLVGTVSAQLTARFSELIALGEEEALRSTFTKGSQVGILALLFPVAALLTAPAELYYMWLRNSELAAEIGSLAPVAMISTALLTQTTLVFQAEIARGRMQFYVMMTAARLILILLSWNFLLSNYGIWGALCAGLAMTLAECLLVNWFILGRQIPGAGAKWLIDLLIFPAVILFPAVMGARFMVDILGIDGSVFIGMAVKLAVAFGIITILAFVMPSTRSPILDLIRHSRFTFPFKSRLL